MSKEQSVVAEVASQASKQALALMEVRNIDPKNVGGSGVNGRITIEDVQKHIEANHNVPTTKESGLSKAGKKTWMWRSKKASYTLPITIKIDGDLESRVLEWKDNWLILDQGDKEHQAIHDRLLNSRLNPVEFDLHEDKDTSKKVEDSASVITKLMKQDVAQLKMFFSPEEIAAAGLHPDEEDRAVYVALFLELGKTLG